MSAAEMGSELDRSSPSIWAGRGRLAGVPSDVLRKHLKPLGLNTGKAFGDMYGVGERQGNKLLSKPESIDAKKLRRRLAEYLNGALGSCSDVEEYNRLLGAYAEFRCFVLSRSLTYVATAEEEKRNLRALSDIMHAVVDDLAGRGESELLESLLKHAAIDGGGTYTPLMRAVEDACASRLEPGGEHPWYLKVWHDLKP